MATRRKSERKLPKKSVASSKSRDAVLEDFRKIVGPLRGRNRDLKAKP